MAVVSPALRAVLPAADFGDEHQATSPVRPAAVRLNTPMAWEGSQFAEEDSFIVRLTAADLAEVDKALVSFQETNLPPGYLSPQTFVLPTLGPKLRLASHRVHEAEGFVVLRGLQPWCYKRLENTIVFAGIASYIGNRRGLQCADGPVMTHIFDYSTEVEEKEKINEGYLGHANRTSYLPFHTDDGHLISLYCLQSADIGGRTLVASSHAIYNRLLETRPDVIDTLKGSWLWDSFIAADPSFTRPLLMEHDGRMICNYRIRPFLGTPGYPRNAALGALPAHQEEALNVVAQIADELCLRFEFQTGDLQFLNNLGILHAREEFRRAEGDNTRRHLLRLVLKDDELAWQLPAAFNGTMERMFDHGPDEETFVWSPEPLPYVIGQ